VKYTGKQKARFLLSVLQEDSESVLAKLNPDSAALLSDSLEETPQLSDEELSVFLDNILSLVSQKEWAVTPEPADFQETQPEENDFLEFESESDLESSSYPDTYRHLEEIVEKLKEQDDQMIAFFFKHADSALVTDLKSYFTEDRLDVIAQISVEDVPMTARIYRTLFNMIVLKEGHTVEDEFQPSEHDAQDEAKDTHEDHLHEEESEYNEGLDDTFLSDASQEDNE